MIPSVTVAQAIANVYQRATRKVATLDISTGKGQQILGLLNFFQIDWANDSNTDWHSLRQIFTLPAVVTATDTFSLSTLTTLSHLSRQEGDFVRVYHTDGVGESDYTIVDAQTLYNDGHQLNSIGQNVANANGTCAMVGTNLVFDRPFLATDPQIGGTIKLPGYKNVNTLAATTDIIQCDDPQWLEVRCAAEFVLNDVTRVQNYPTLKNEADSKYEDMIQANESQVDKVYQGGWALLGQTWQ